MLTMQPGVGISRLRCGRLHKASILIDCVSPAPAGGISLRQSIESRVEWGLQDADPTRNDVRILRSFLVAAVVATAVLLLSTGPVSAQIADCNSNGVDDSLDISGSTSLDCNTNTIPDECELGCLSSCGDIDGSGGNVDLVDFASFAVCFNASPSSSAACACSDLNGDGSINLQDFATLSLVFNGVSTNTPPNCP